MRYPSRRQHVLVVCVLVALFTSVSAIAADPVVIRWAEYPRAGMDEFAAEAIALFQQEYPHVQIEYEPLLDAAQVTTAMAGGVGPDVLTWWTDYLRSWGELGFLVDLGPYMDRDFTADDLDDFNPGQLQEFTLPNGSRYALPLFGGTLATWINKDRFDESGVPYPEADWTWDDMRDVARRLTQYDSEGNFLYWGAQASLPYERIVPWIWQNGGDVHAPGDNSVAWLDQPAAVGALQFLADLMHEDRVMPAGGWAVGTGGGDGGLGNGRTGMEFEGSWAINWYMSRPELNIGIAHLPQGPGGQASIIAYEGYGLYKDSKHPEEAWAWLRFLTGQEANELRAKCLGLQPARRSAAVEWLYATREAFPAASNAELEVFLETWFYAKPAPMFSNNTAAMTAIQSALTRIFQGQGSAQSVMSEVIPALNAQLAQ